MFFFQTPASCIEKAKDLLNSTSHPKPKCVVATSEEMELSLKHEAARNEEYTE